jgi:hypothetical protein
MPTLASQLGLLRFLLAVFAAVFAPRSTFGDRARAGGMRTFLGVVHYTPPSAAAILHVFVLTDLYNPM